MKKLLFIVIATLGVSMAAHANFEIEPAIGVQGTGSTQFNYKFNGTAFTYYQQSYPISLALKWHAMNGFIFGLNASYFLGGTLTATGSQAGSGTQNDAFTRTVGAVILGYESPKGFRVWVGYDALNNISNTPGTNANAADIATLNNTGEQVGIGWRFKDHFAVNAVYDAVGTTPSAVTTKTSTGTFSSSTYNGFTDGTIQVNLSFPFGGSK